MTPFMRAICRRRPIQATLLICNHITMTNKRRKTIGLADPAKLDPFDKSDEIDPIARRCSSLFTHRYDSVDHLHVGDKPLVVLSADVGWDLSGPVGSFWRTYRKLWLAQHEALAHVSSRGVHRVIEHSRHQIQLDKPQAVVDAVDEVLRELPAGAKS